MTFTLRIALYLGGAVDGRRAVAEGPHAPAAPEVVRFVACAGRTVVHIAVQVVFKIVVVCGDIVVLTGSCCLWGCGSGRCPFVGGRDIFGATCGQRREILEWRLLSVAAHRADNVDGLGARATIRQFASGAPQHGRRGPAFLAEAGHTVVTCRLLIRVGATTAPAHRHDLLELHDLMPLKRTLLVALEAAPLAVAQVAAATELDRPLPTLTRVLVVRRRHGCSRRAKPQLPRFARQSVVGGQPNADAQPQDLATWVG